MNEKIFILTLTTYILKTKVPKKKSSFIKKIKI
ncbi:MAG: hypothetical protein JWQ28_695 [Pedobacter sp.]|jgi:hypothetical protein|nr:hypothetical protein [Pedobacter sp.]